MPGKGAEACPGSIALAAHLHPPAAAPPPPAPPQNATRLGQLPSYVLSGTVDPSLAREARFWLLGILFVAVGCVRLVPTISAQPLSYQLGAQGGMCTMALALLLACPAAYLRLVWWIHLAAHIVMLGGVVMLRRGHEARQLGLLEPPAGSGGLRTSLTFLSVFLTLSGVNSGVTALVFVQLPPAATAAAAAVWTMVLASGNRRVCGLQLLQHPAAAWHVDLLYSCMHPLVAPLEPLMLAVGIGRDHPARHCHCVLAALQFWLVAVGAAAAVACGQARSYTAWRWQQRRQDRERRKRQAEVRAVYTAEQEVLSRTDAGGAAWTGPTARVTFTIKRQLPFGQVLKVVGGHYALGEWEISDAPEMSWSEGDVWMLVLDLPAGEHEFKVAAVAQAASVEQVVEWEAGPNRLLQVPWAEAKMGGAFSLALEWGNPGSSWVEGQEGQEGSAHSSGGATSASQLTWTIDDERAARQVAEAERSQLRAERDSLAVQLRHAQQQLEAALAEKAQLEAAAQRAQHNIDVLRQVGQLLRTMHTD
ncbi:hypothetical protein ABPG75_003565 [Micractinium tetrahymenae]